MTTDKLLEAFTKHSREAKRNARIAKLLEKEILSIVKVARAKKELKIKTVAAASKIPLSRVINVLYNGAAMKPSEAKTLIQAVNG
jgi:hypothetical protein